MPDSAPTQLPNSGNLYRVGSAALASLLAVAVGWFVARRLGASLDEVSSRLTDADRPLLLLTLVAAAASMTLIAAGWTYFLRAVGHTAPTSDIVAWYFIGEITKYLPGGLWAFVGRGELAAGPVKRRVAYRTVTDSLLTFFALASLPSAAAVLIYVDQTLLLRALVAAGAVAVYPSVAAILGVRGRALVGATVVYSAAWVMIGVTTWITAAAVGAELGVLPAIAITAASWLVGFVVVFVPGGIGIRESTFVLLSTSVLEENDALAVALICRSVFIIADLLGAILGSAFRQWKRS